MQIEGRGNGIKTNVVNNVEIAKALERPPDCESWPAHSYQLGNLRTHHLLLTSGGLSLLVASGFICTNG